MLGKIFLIVILFVLPKGMQGETPLSSGQNSFPRIRNIKIVIHDIYETEPDKRARFPYRLANTLHFKTKDFVVRRELLFRRGDVVNDILLQETERNLRNLLFFKDANVRKININQQQVDVLVEVEDQWTTVIGTKFSHEAGESLFGIRLEEYNVGGFGQTIKFSYSQTKARSYREAALMEPRILNTRWSFTYIHKEHFDGHSDVVILHRPFYSQFSRFSSGVYWERFEGERYFYPDVGESLAYDSEQATFKTFVSRLLDSNGWWRSGVSFFSLSKKDDYKKPEDRSKVELSQVKLRQLTLALSYAKLTYIEETYLDRFARTEDVPLGQVVNLMLGCTSRFYGSNDNNVYLGMIWDQAWRMWNTHYLYMGFYTSCYFSGRTFRKLWHEGSVKYFWRLGARNTLVSNFRLTLGERMPPERQLFLGGINAIRGLEEKQLVGQNRWILNLEDRFFTNLNLFDFYLGGIFFIDVGNIWFSTSDFDWKSTCASAGFGLRLGNSRVYGSKVTRLDFAFPIHGPVKFQVCFATGQFFGAFKSLSYINPFPRLFGEE
ncbi:hypothetical protein DRQ15_10845 [candidate division KSB1 bacterium]|nr:MAG: hypothetical protein DRQ15_10845 [candidate division KSB1 bacterium]